MQEAVVNAQLTEIKKDCTDFPISNYYKTVLTDDTSGTELTVWMDAKTYQVVCAVKETQGVKTPVANAPATTTTSQPTTTTSAQICLQVLTPAYNPTTKECKVFKDSCIDVGWIRGECPYTTTTAPGSTTTSPAATTTTLNATSCQQIVVKPSILFTLTGKGALWSPDGARIAGISNNKISVWDVSGGLVNTINYNPKDFSWSPASNKFATVSNDKTIRIFDIASASELKRQNLSDVAADDIGSVKWSPDGSKIAVQLFREIKIYNSSDLSLLVNMSPGTVISGVYWSSDGSKLISSESSSLAIIRNTTNLNSIKTLYDVGSPVSLSSNDKEIVSFGFNNSQLSSSYLGIKDIVTGSESKKLRSQSYSLINVGGLAWSSDGVKIAASTYQSEGAVIHIWDACSGTELNTSNIKDPVGGGVNKISWSPDSTKIAVSSNIISVLQIS